MAAVISHVLFTPGVIVSTPGALEAFEEAKERPMTLLLKHIALEIGDLCSEDLTANIRALKFGGRILSAYRLSTGCRIWIITEASRDVTTFLLPEEY